jgi:hypothetical protein
VPEQELNGPEIPGPPVDQCRFRASQRMRAVSRGVQSNGGDPRSDDPGILWSFWLDTVRRADGANRRAA